MIAEAVRRSPLADYAERFTALDDASSGAISMRELPFLTQINLRVDPTDDAVMGLLAGALNVELPITPDTVATRADLRALWLGPNEWLIVGTADQPNTIEESVRVAASDAHVSIVNVSANRTCLLIRGARAHELLAYGAAIDLHPRPFASGRCAQTLLAKAQVIIERRSHDAFHVYVRCSYARYLADWLLDASGSLE